MIEVNNFDIMNYWIESATKDYTTMYILYNNQQYTWSLFFGHLVTEKLLKAVYAISNPKNPYTVKTHNLLLLAQKCELKLTGEQIHRLQIITQFNICARYDDFKQTFEKKCTQEYTKIQIKKIEEVITWLKELLKMK